MGFLSAVKDATSTSPAARPTGAGSETVVVAVSVDAVRELRSAIPGPVPPPASTVIVRVLVSEPSALVTVSRAV